MAKTPQRFTPRAGSQSSGRLRRYLDGGIDSDQRNGRSLEVGKDGRLEAKIAVGGGLEISEREGLRIRLEDLGEKNRPMLNSIRDPEAGATAADLRLKLMEILKELRRTGNMRG